MIYIIYRRVGPKQEEKKNKSRTKNYRFDPTYARPPKGNVTWQPSWPEILISGQRSTGKEVGGEPTTDLSVSDKGEVSPRSPWSPSIPPISWEGQSPAAAKQTPSKPGLGS